MTKPVRYHLRIAFSSSFSASEETVLWDILRRGRIDEAMFIVPHIEPRSPGLGTLDECERCADRLRPIFDRLRDDAIAPAINVWWTAGFSDFSGLARDQRDDFDFRWAVRADGYKSHACACPQDMAWRRHIREMYGIFARLEPARLWVDDDMRMTLKADTHSPCFCDECIARMRERTGSAITRERITAAILADPPNTVRDAWLEFQGDLMIEIAKELADAVHAASPQTHVGWMGDNFEVLGAEGRCRQRLHQALGTPTPFYRPSIGAYHDTTAVEHTHMFSACRLTQAGLPADAILAPEIEHYPHTRFLKSVRSMAMHLCVGQLLGMNDVTMNIYRSEGRLDLADPREDVLSGALAELKPRLQGIADLGICSDQFDGVSLYFHEDVCRHTRGVADLPKPVFLYRYRPFDDTLPLLGIATRYGVGKVTAFAGEQINCLSDDDREAVFSRGVLMDGRAAESMLLAGHGALAGVRSRLGSTPGSFETVEDAAFGGQVGNPINTRWEGEAIRFEWLDGARVVSVIRDYDSTERGHGMVLFENALGGRVAVLPYDSQQDVASLGTVWQPNCSPGFLSFARQAQMVDALRWLNRGPLPLLVPNAPSVYPLLIRQEDRLIVSVTNLLPDPVEDLMFELAAPGFELSAVQHLQDDGTWRSVEDAAIERASDDGRTVVRTPLTVSYLGSAVLVLTTG
ncbi:MAG: hypothetical protein CMJ49_14700 [Planctomycetaceae bacterium]|nr:hypothetical protein [Planctomycetaceae bacterium]